ncbi:MAG TPA: hypothetical protein VF622_17185 [Segetibacter sp.]
MNLKVFASFIFILSLLMSCEKLPGVDGTITESNLNYKTVGASANELLSADKPSLVVEIHYMKGYALQSATLNNIVSFVQTYMNKPGGVQIWQKEIPASTNPTLTTTDLANIEKEHRTAYSTSKQVAVYILVTNGRFTDANTIGCAYLNTSLSLFGKTIQQFSTGYSLTFKSKLETSTAQHEFGHLLGLVNMGTPMQVNHADVEHKGHCTNPKCLMYYKAGHAEMQSYLTNGVATLDANCRNDLNSNK